MRAGSYCGRLGGREGAKGGLRELRPVGQREVRGQQRVAAEEGEEPRHAGAGYQQVLAVRSDGWDAQPGEVAQALLAGTDELVGDVPYRKRGLVGEVVPLAPDQRQDRADVGRPDGARVGSARMGGDPDGDLRGAVRGEPDAPGKGSERSPGCRGHRGLRVGGDRGVRLPLLAVVGEAGAVRRVRDGDVGAGLVVDPAVAAQFELVGEVRVGIDGDDDRDLACGVVAEPQVLGQPAVEQGLSAVQCPRRRFVAGRGRGEHGGGSPVAVRRHEDGRLGAVHREAPVAEMAGVADEQSVG